MLPLLCSAKSHLDLHHNFNALLYHSAKLKSHVTSDKFKSVNSALYLTLSICGISRKAWPGLDSDKEHSEGNGQLKSNRAVT